MVISTNFGSIKNLIDLQNALALSRTRSEATKREIESLNDSTDPDDGVIALFIIGLLEQTDLLILQVDTLLKSFNKYSEPTTNAASNQPALLSANYKLSQPEAELCILDQTLAQTKLALAKRLLRSIESLQQTCRLVLSGDQTIDSEPIHHTELAHK